MVSKNSKTKKKVKKNIPFGIAHISSTFNNTVITITDTTGNTISWSSSGNKGFKGSQKLFIGCVIGNKMAHINIAEGSNQS